MKNYKLLESRPELTSEQLRQGMDFNKIQIKAALAKKAIVKALFIKGIAGIAIIASGIFIYSEISHSVLNKAALKPEDSVIQSPMIIKESLVNTKKATAETPEQNKNEDKKSAALTQSIKNYPPDSVKSDEGVTKINPVTPGDKEPSEVSATPIVDSTVTRPEAPLKSRQSSTVTRVKSCKIWNTTNVCNLPKTAKFVYSMDCNVEDFDYRDCQSVNQLGNFTIVWLTVASNGKSTFQIENQLKNINLVKAHRNKVSSPLMIGVNRDSQFLGANLKAKKLVAHFDKQMDFFLFFKDAKEGDKIIIKNFIEALIEK